MTGDSDARATFLLSSERSGSNLVRSILNTHSEISAPHPLETAYPWQYTAAPSELSSTTRRKLTRDILINKQYSHHPLTIPLDPDRVADRIDLHPDPSFLTVQSALYQEACDVEDTSVWVSKNPGLWEVLEEGLSYYDDLKIVYLVRDVRDVVLSFKTSNLALFHPYLSANRWQGEQSTGIDLLERLADDTIHLVQYEDLLQDPEDNVSGICDFLDLPFEQGMLYYYETEDAKEAAQSAEVFENLSIPIQSDNFGKFHEQLPDEEVLIAEKVAGSQLDAFGYDLVNENDMIERFDLDPTAYRRENAKLARHANRRFWREDTREQIQRYLSTSFTAYMVLRYGVLA